MMNMIVIATLPYLTSPSERVRCRLL